MEDVIERLRKFVLANPEMSKSGYIKGLDPTGKVVVMENGIEKRITIDELEGNNLNQSVSQTVSTPSPIVEPSSNQASEEIEVMDEEPSQTKQNVEVLSDNNEINTLKDFQNAVLSKNEILVNKALESFALDNTGKINMNKAIKIVTDNCTNNVINSIRDNVILPSDLSMYDITSKPIVTLQKAQQKENLPNLIDKSFNNILVYVEAARLKNVVYNQTQIESAKKKYATGIQDKINVLGLNKTEDAITPDNVKEEKAISLELQPDKNIKKAGFADILILTIIVLIYAAIIINLITKLK